MVILVQTVHNNYCFALVKFLFNLIFTVFNMCFCYHISGEIKLCVFYIILYNFVLF